MSSLLIAMAHDALHHDGNATATDVRAAAHVMLALSSSKPEEILQQVSAAHALDVPLEHVGSLALYRNCPLVAQVLREHFDIKPEDYLTLGDESGIDCRSDYPTLAMAAHMGLDAIQARALAWGADPNAHWRVDRIQGDYHGKAQTISWVSENIRRLNEDMVDRLLDVAAPPPREEQLRRLSALSVSTHRFSRDYFHRFRAMVDRFAPNGPHALAVSPWDLKQGGSSLAEDRTVACAHRGAYDEPGRALAGFNDWIQATVPQKGDYPLRCLRGVIRSAKSEHSFDLPAWCVDRLTPKQAQLLLHDAWSMMIPLWSQKLTSTVGSWDQADRFVKDRAKVLEPVVAIAQSAPLAIATWSPRLLLAALPSPFALEKVSSHHLAVLLDHIPVLQGKTATSNLDDLHALVSRAEQHRKRLLQAKNSHAANAESEEHAARADLSALSPEFKVLHDKLRLELVAAQAKAEPAAVVRPKM